MQAVILGVRLEVDPDGTIVYDSMKDHLEKKRHLDDALKAPPAPPASSSGVKFAAASESSSSRSPPSSPPSATPPAKAKAALPRAGGGVLRKLTSTFQRVARKALDADLSFLGRPFTEDLFDQWNQVGRWRRARCLGRSGSFFRARTWLGPFFFRAREDLVGTFFF